MKRRDPKQPHVQLYTEFSERLRGDHWQPDVDIFETESSVVVRAELAGVRRGDLKVTVDQNVLRIRGIREGAGSGALQLHQMEIASGPFERRVRIPIEVDSERVNARLEDGLLTVTLARRDPVRHSVSVEKK